MNDTERPTLPRWTRYAISAFAGLLLWVFTAASLGLAAVTLGLFAAVCVNALLKAWRPSR